MNRKRHKEKGGGGRKERGCGGKRERESQSDRPTGSYTEILRFFHLISIKQILHTHTLSP